MHDDNALPYEYRHDMNIVFDTILPIHGNALMMDE
jgi:hypothetical protein